MEYLSTRPTEPIVDDVELARKTNKSFRTGPNALAKPKHNITHDERQKWRRIDNEFTLNQCQFRFLY